MKIWNLKKETLILSIAIGISGGISIPNIFFRFWYRSIPVQIVLISAFSVILFFCCLISIRMFNNLSLDKKQNIYKILILLIAIFLFFILKFPITLEVPNSPTDHRLSVKIVDKKNSRENSLIIEIIELKIDNKKINLESLIDGGKGIINEKGFLEISGTEEFSLLFSANQNSTVTILFNGNKSSGRALCTLDNQVIDEIDLYQNDPTERIMFLRSPTPLSLQTLTVAQNIFGIIFGIFILFLFSIVIDIINNSLSKIGLQVAIVIKNNLTAWSRVLCSIFGVLFAVYITLFLCMIQIKAAISYEYFTPATNIEEAAYTYTAASNYVKYGLMNSMLLQDHSYSIYPEGHPYVYTHMPAGPDLFYALLLLIYKGNFQAVRVALIVPALIGLFFYYIFIKIILKGIGIKTNLAGYAIALIGPWTIIRLFESQIYPLFPFLAFFPLLAWEKYRSTNKKWWYILFAFISFLSALYIEYSLLTSVLFCYISLYLTQIIRFSRRDIIIYSCSLLSGIILHLIQNLFFYGPANFIQELIYLLGNRIVGYPSQEQLFEFYHQLGVVHHGAHPIDFGLLLTQICGNLHIINIGENANVNKIFVILIFALFIGFHDRVLQNSGKNILKMPIIPFSEDTLHILKITIWMVITLLIPILLFPAFAQEVNSATFGGNFFFAIFEISIIGLSIKQVFNTIFISNSSTPNKEIENKTQHKTEIQKERIWDYSRIKNEILDVISSKSRITSSLLIKVSYLFLITINIIFVYQFIVEQYTFTIRKTEYVDQVLSKSEKKLNLDASLLEIKRFNGQLFMTNINIPTVGFLVQYPGYGVCDPDSISDSGDVKISECGTDFIKSTDRITLSQQPRYFFYFTTPGLFPGFASCMPSSTMIGARGGSGCMKLMYRRLSDNYEQVFSNKIVSVFDFQKRIEKKD
jgi:hypothetical protein